MSIEEEEQQVKVETVEGNYSTFHIRYCLTSCYSVLLTK